MTGGLLLGFFALLLGLVVGVHEAGHLAAALACRIRIEELGIGLPPRLLRLGQLGRTRISLNLLPMGGFVRPAGEFDPTVPGGLAASTPWRRVVVSMAGAVANLLLALALLSAGFASRWPDRVRVVAVYPGSPAAAAGMQVGDVILAFEGARVTSADDLGVFLRGHAGEAVGLRLGRGEGQQNVILRLRIDSPPGEGPAGFDSQGELVSYALPAAVGRATETLGTMAVGTARAVASLLAGEARSSGVQVIGPLGLKRFSDRAITNAIEWNLAYPLLYLGSWLSTAIALVNLLPLPALDGGRVALALAEGLFRRHLPPRVERRIHAAGMVMLLLVLFVLTVRDVAARLV